MSADRMISETIPPTLTPATERFFRGLAVVILALGAAVIFGL